MADNKRKQTKTTKTTQKKQKLAAATTSPKPAAEKSNKKKKQVEEKPQIIKHEAIDSESESEKIQKLLEPYTKDQLIEFLCDAAATDASLVDRIQSIADQDVSHRKIFVHGLAWNTTRETLHAAFESYGEMEECNLVVDRPTGRAKGYAFIMFKSRSGAAKALKEPQKNINNRMTHCQLASAGPVAPNQFQDTAGRKIYVSNVHAEVNADKLRAFFAKFGEIEMGPLGFDNVTGKSRGFALFIYKTFEGAKKAIEEPYKMFEGHQLHCQRASDNKNKPLQPTAPAAAIHLQQQQQGLQQRDLAAIAAAQNMAIFGQHPSLNPVYGGLVPGSVNPLLSTATQGTSGGLVGGYNTASHGMGILGGGNTSLYGAYANPSLQSMHSYQASQLGQSSSSRNAASFSGYPSYM